MNIYVKCLKEKTYRKEMNKTWRGYDRPGFWSIMFGRTPASILLE